MAVCCCSDFAQLVEQAGVFDRDDGLVGETRDQLDLLVGERAHFCAINGDRADQIVLLEHRHGEQGANAGDYAVARHGSPSGRHRSACIGRRCLRRAAATRRSGHPEPGGYGPLPQCSPYAGGRRGKGGVGSVALVAVKHAKVGLADARRVREHGVEHGLSSPGELEMTCSTSEVAVCCSSDSLSSRVRACTSSNSRAFSIAITAWSAKVVTSSICRSVKALRASR